MSGTDRSSRACGCWHKTASRASYRCFGFRVIDMALPVTPHDQLLYPAGTFACTHPSRLAVLGTLFGMSPAPIEHCRVLELGCGLGANLLPMAAALPGSTFTGIDLAARPIAQGEAIR